MNRRLFFIATVLPALLMLLSCSREQKHPPAIQGNPAPPFSLKNPDGNTVRLDDFLGKIVVLDFWATWCGPCVEATGEVEALNRRYGEKGVVFIGVSMDKGGDAVQKVKAFVKKEGLTYRFLMDDGKASAAYAVARIPDTFVLDRGHRIIRNYPGYRRDLGRRIASDIESLLGGK